MAARFGRDAKSVGMGDTNSLEAVLGENDMDSPLALAIRNAPLPKPIQALIKASTVEVLRRDRVMGAEEKFSAGMKDRQLYQDVRRHLGMEEKLDWLKGDLSSSLDKGMRSAAALGNLETRILALRSMLRTSDATANVGKGDPSLSAAAAKSKHLMATAGVKTSTDLIMEELEGIEGTNRAGMEQCPKCEKLFLTGFLRKHLEDCDGNRDVQSSDEDSEDEAEKEKTGAAPEKLADRADRMAKKSAALRECPVCSRKFDAARLDKHIEACQVKADRAAARASAVAESTDPAAAAALREHATVPKPPMKVRALAAGPTSIPLLWDSPLFDGGAPIIEYEIAYSIVVDVRLNRRETNRETRGQPQISTTRWGSTAPVAHRGFTMTDLPGGTEFVDIRVRAINEKGPGEWSEPLKSAKTLPAVPPSPPLHLRLVPAQPPTSSTFTVQWEEPLDSGGERVAQYEVRYNALVPDFESAARARVMGLASQDNKMKAIPKSLRIDASSRQVVVSGLLGPATYTGVCVIAITTSGMASVPGVALSEVHTLKMSRVDHLQYELADKRSRQEVDITILDSSGFMQVVNRLDYIGRLEAELSKLLGGQAEADVPAADAPTKAEKKKEANSALPEAYQREVIVRRTQFESRIAILQAKLEGLDNDVFRLMGRRTELKSMLVIADKRYRVLRAEMEQVKEYRGKFIDSSVMHGRNQRFPAAQLRGMISEELDEVTNVLSVGKREMVTVTEDVEAHKGYRKAAQDALKERKGAFMCFEGEETRKARAAKFAARLGQVAVYRCFAAWKGTLEAKKRAQQRMSQFMGRWGNMALSTGFRQWWNFVLAERKKERAKAFQERDDMMPGLGSALLIAAEKQRTEASEDAVTLLAWLRRVEGELDAANASLQHRRQIRDADLSVIAPRGGPAVRAAAAAAAASGRYFFEAERELVASQVAITRSVGSSFGADGEIKTIPVPSLRMIDGVRSVVTSQAVVGASVAENRAEARMAADIGDAGVDDAVAYESNKKLLATKGPDAILEGQLAEDVLVHARSLVARAEAYMRAGECEKSLLALKRAEMVYGWRKDARGLLAVYRLLATLLEKVGRWDIGVLHWDRCLQMAKEPHVADVMATAEAYEGRGRCLTARACHADALLAFERAEDIHESRCDQPAIARCLRAEAAALDMTGRPGKAKEYRGRADEIEFMSATLIRQGINRLVELESDLIGQGLAASRLVRLEPVGPSVPLIRQQIRFVEAELRKLVAVNKSTKTVMDREEKKLGLLAEECEKAEASGARTMETRLLTGSAQVYEVTELRFALRAEQKNVTATVMEARKEFAAVSTRVANLTLELENLRIFLDAETRELSKLAHMKRPLRCAAINSANVRTNNVLGAATGGMPKVAAVVDEQAFAFGSLDGECVQSFLGDSERNPMGNPVGHVKVVTALAYYGAYMYTGSQDATIRVWDVEGDRGWGKRGPIEAALEVQEKVFLAEAMAAQDLEEEEALAERREFVRAPIAVPARDPFEMRRARAGHLMVLKGHAATITSLAVNHSIILSGSADKTAIIWHAKSGALLRRLRGHEFAVTAVALDESTLATGGADREVRLWRILKTTGKNPAKSVEMSLRLRGHTAAVTCLSLQGLELVSGSSDGKIIVWDTVVGAPLRIHTVHENERAVLCLQFDAVKVISAGADNRLVFTDLINGDALATTIRPHADAFILALSFDTERLVTMASDRTMRIWGFKGADPIPLVKLHVLKPNEKIPLLARKFGVKVKDIMRWNGVTDVRTFYDGMRIIVAPPPGSDAYEAALEEDACTRREADAAVARAERAADEARRLGESGAGGDPSASASAEQALMDSIVARVRAAEAAQIALDKAAESIPAPEIMNGANPNLPSATMGPVASRGPRKVAAATNVWAKFSATGTALEAVAEEGEGEADREGLARARVPPIVDPVSTTVGAAVRLPTDSSLLAKALRLPTGQGGTINPSPSPFARSGSLADLERQRAQAASPRTHVVPVIPGLRIGPTSGAGGGGSVAGTSVATGVSKGGSRSVKQGTYQELMVSGAAGTGNGLVRARNIRSMAAAAQTNLPPDSDAIKNIVKSSLSRPPVGDHTF